MTTLTGTVIALANSYFPGCTLYTLRIDYIEGGDVSFTPSQTPHDEDVITVNMPTTGWQLNQFVTLTIEAKL